MAPRFPARHYVSHEDRTIPSNTVEDALSIFKRGMKGVYQHCGEQHFHRYLAEFEFRYSNRVALRLSRRRPRRLHVEG
jgi:ISXO2-like transposase domain